MKVFCRWLGSILPALASLLLLATPVLAIAQPDVPTQILAVYAYRHVLEDNDQLYIVDETTPYAALPTESANQALIVRLMNGATVLQSVAPNSYHQSGWNRNLIVIYFAAASAPAWSGAYTVQVVGNPTLSWAGGTPPSTTSTGIDYWSSSTSIAATQAELASKIIYLAGQLDISWAVGLTTVTSAGTKLSTTTGEVFYAAVFPAMRSAAPAAYSGSTTSPAYSDNKTYHQNWAVELLAGSTGTPFDMSGLGLVLGVSKGWAGFLVWAVLYGVIAYFVVRAFHNTKPAVIISVPWITLGYLLGMVPLLFAIGLGVLCLWLTGHVLFYQKSGA